MQKKKKEYNDCISLLMIKDVVKYESKKKNTWKFQIICHNIKTNHKRKKIKIKYIFGNVIQKHRGING